MGLLDIYGLRRRKNAEPEEPPVEEEKLEPLPKISKDELWPPSPRVKMLYIGIGFGLFNFLLLAIFVWVWIAFN